MKRNNFDISKYLFVIVVLFSLALSGVSHGQVTQYRFVGPRDNIPVNAPRDYGFWSFSMPAPRVLSRSGQPLMSGFEWLKRNGWKSVVNFRKDGERGEIADDLQLPGFKELGFKYIRIPIADGAAPTDDQAFEFLRFVTNPDNWPIHIHCRGGIGRSGIMTALYRYTVEGWPVDKAIEETRPYQGGVSQSQERWLRKWAEKIIPGSLRIGYQKPVFTSQVKIPSPSPVIKISPTPPKKKRWPFLLPLSSPKIFKTSPSLRVSPLPKIKSPSPKVFVTPRISPIPSPSRKTTEDRSFEGTLWITDFGKNKIVAIDALGNVVWQFDGNEPATDPRFRFENFEYISIQPNGNVLATDEIGQQIVEIDVGTKQVVWHFGEWFQPGSDDKHFNAPDVAWRTLDDKVLVTDGNNRRVMIIDPRTNKIVWQYGKTLKIGKEPGLLGGAEFAMELPDANIWITDTFFKRALIVSRQTKEVLWQWSHPNLRYPAAMSITPEGNFLLVDNLAREIFEITPDQRIVWHFKSAPSGPLRVGYLRRAYKMENGNYMILDQDNRRIFIIDPKKNEIVWQYSKGLAVPTYFHWKK